MNSQLSFQEQFHELSFYTLSLQDKEFIHQHIVDAYTAQTADKNTKPISLIFSLAGLYLHIEKNYTGKEVQLAHIQMAKNKLEFPEIVLPEHRGNITVTDVLATNPGHQRDEMIHQWCVSVWDAFADQHEVICSLTQTILKNYLNRI
jgi:hypothetical protein